jgi:glycosyltransferase involved in cell wall biosynthesis
MLPITTIIPREYSLGLNGEAVPCVEYSYPEAAASTPLVSVAMITYNHETYIGQAIEGVARQQRTFPVELIIGEDCSTDGTRALVFRYQQKYPELIRVITSENNVGMRKNGLRTYAAARGKYIAYCEGDDCWHDPGKLQRQVDYLEEHSECGMVYTNADAYHVLSGQRTRMAMPHRPELCNSDDPYLQQLTGARIIWPLTVCLRKAVLDQVTRECPEITDTSLPMGDTPRFLEMARRTVIHYMPIATATHNLLPESATQFRDIARKAQFIARCSQVTLHYLDKYPVPERYDRQIRRWIYLRELEYAFLCRDADRARRALAALKEKKIRAPLRYRLYYVGAVTPLLYILIRGHFAAMSVAVAVRHALLPSRVTQS